jgi:NAD(P)-dependent dehydrogenase (short-subunit alcohol dehydrogenase family)
LKSATSDRLKGKVALVTGGGRGIGKAIAGRLADSGATVAICSRTKRELEETAREIKERGGEIWPHVADLASAKAVRNLVQDLLRRHSKIDVLINNASLLGPHLPIAEFPLSDWEAILRVNLTAPFLLAQEAIRSMVPRKSGFILNITSSVGRQGRARWGGYSASKFGLEGLTQILADELREHEIRVLALNPGGTRTAMRARAYPDEDPTRLPSPDAIAGVVLDLILSEDRSLCGQSLDARSILKESNEGMSK